MHKGIYKKDNLILRCLDVNGSECLVIDCVKKTMPSWVDQNLLNDYEEISEESLLKELNVTLPSISTTTKNNAFEIWVNIILLSKSNKQ